MSTKVVERRHVIRRVALLAIVVAGIIEIAAAFMPWVQFGIPISDITIAGVAQPLNVGVATAGLSVFALFVAGARLSGSRGTPDGWLPRLSGAVVVALSIVALVLITGVSHRISGDDAGISAVAINNAGQDVDHNPASGLEVAIAGCVALAIAGCALLLSDNPDDRAARRLRAAADATAAAPPDPA